MQLVVGATGLVGGTVARRLRAQGGKVRALLRGGLARKEAAELRLIGVDIEPGELGDRSSLVAACRGVDTVVCTATSMPAAGGDALQRVDNDGVLDLISEAENAGVRRFIYLSYSGGIGADSPLGRAKRTCEARLAESPMESVVLRPSYFMQVWLGPHLGFNSAAATARIYGDGTAGISYVSAVDVAAFAVAAALHHDPLRGFIEIGGPRILSQLDAVAIFERATRRRFAIEHVPIAVIEEQRRSADPLQQTLSELMMGCALGNPVPEALANASLYGVALGTVEDFAAGRPG
jgi:uncharacterized protein YbjT (DUF2867 family)